MSRPGVRPACVGSAAVLGHTLWCLSADGVCLTPLPQLVAGLAFGAAYGFAAYSINVRARGWERGARGAGSHVVKHGVQQPRHAHVCADPSTGGQGRRRGHTRQTTQQPSSPLGFQTTPCTVCMSPPLVTSCTCCCGRTQRETPRPDISQVTQNISDCVCSQSCC